MKGLIFKTDVNTSFILVIAIANCNKLFCICTYIVYVSVFMHVICLQLHCMYVIKFYLQLYCMYVRLEPNMLKIYLLFLTKLPKIFTHYSFIPIAPQIIPILFYCVSDNITMQE